MPRINPQEIVDRVEDLQALRLSDKEAIRTEEDNIRRQVLKAIADGDFRGNTARTMAHLAWSTDTLREGPKRPA